MKKLLSLLLIVVLAFTAVGCNKNDNNENNGKNAGNSDKVMEKNENEAIALFEDMLAGLADHDNMSMKNTTEVSLDQLEMMGLPNPIVVEMSSDAYEAGNMKVNLAVDLGIMPLEAEMFITKEQLLLHSEILGAFVGTPYMGMDLTEVVGTIQEASENDEEMNKLRDMIKRFEASSEYSIYDIFVIEDKVDTEKLTINDEKVEAKHFKMTFSTDKIIDVVYDILTFASEDEEARKMLLDKMTDAEIEEMKTEMLDPEKRAEFEEAFEALAINAFEFDFYVNEDLAPVMIKMNLDIAGDIEGEAFDLKVEMVQEMFNFGKVEEIIVPEVDPSEVMDLLDMVGPMMDLGL